MLLLILGLMFAAGRLLLVRQGVADAARTAAESAVVMASPTEASAAASSNALGTLQANAARCTPATVAVDTSHFSPGGSLFVSVSCTEALGEIAFVSLPGSFELTARAGAIVEPYRELVP